MVDKTGAISSASSMEADESHNPSQLWKKWIRSIRSIGGGPTGIQLVSEVVGVVGVGVMINES